MKLSKKRKESPFKETVPMICPDCDMAYYRMEELKNAGCAFCGGDNLKITSHQHIIQLVESTLLSEPNYHKMKNESLDIAQVSA